ncbi:hypothetical protein [Nitrosopumilus sp.]|uniref:hypothetical protein n=1 Tax=Nitrosopumilus sp. TaxID=2024843 RepID=UPI00349FEC06
MSESRETKGDFEVEQIAKKYFSEIEHAVPHIQQSIFDLQNESYKTWKNAVDANILLQKEFLTKTGFNYVIPDSAKSILENMLREAVKFRELSNKITVSSIESIKNNFKSWNNNAESFVDLNRNIMNYWTSTLLPKTNQS